MIRTYLDETALRFNGAGADVLGDAIDDLVNVMQAVRKHDDERLLVVSDVWDARVEADLTLADFLYPSQGHSGELVDQRRRLSSALDKATSWETPEFEQVVDTYDVTLGDVSHFAPTLAQAAAAAQADGPVACLGLSTARSGGPVKVNVNGVTTTLHGVTSEADRPAFVRAWVLRHEPAPSAFAKWTDRCFPDLAWTEEARGGLRSHSKHFFHDRFETTMRHLGVLNDCTAQLFDDHVETSDRILRLSALDVDASPDSPNTHANQSAAAQRRVRWNGDEYDVSWHTKVRYNNGRIHFHHVRSAGRRSSILIGLCVKHLDT